MRVKYIRVPHSNRCYLVKNALSNEHGFSALEWEVFVKRMKESFPDVEFEEEKYE